MNNKTDSKTQILNSSKNLFSSLPYDRISLRLIAQKCGLSHSLVHRHWRSKEDLFMDSFKSASMDLKLAMSPVPLDNAVADLPTVLSKLFHHRSHTFFKLLRSVVTTPELYTLLQNSENMKGSIKELERLVTGYGIPSLPELNGDTFIMAIFMLLFMDDSSAMCSLIGWNDNRLREAEQRIFSSYLRLAYSLHKEADNEQAKQVSDTA